jgi:hypothetical protein
MRPSEPPGQGPGSRPLLLSCLLNLTAAWRAVFPRQRTFERAVSQALGGLLCLGRRALTCILRTNGRAQSPGPRTIICMRAAGGSLRLSLMSF